MYKILLINGIIFYIITILITYQHFHIALVTANIGSWSLVIGMNRLEHIEIRELRKLV